jgi:uncharacterized protein (DUF4415 family)
MPAKKQAASDQVEVIQRPRGRPKLANPKESINIRLDQDILTSLREIGPGWQSKVNEILRQALNLEPRS